MFFAIAGLVTLRNYAPWGYRMTAARCLAGTATHRVINRIFRHGPAQRANAAMPGPAGFSENDVFMLGVAHLPDCRVTAVMDAANFARRQTHLRVAFVTRHQRSGGPGGADHLRAASGGQFDIVNGQADGNGLKGKTVADIGRSGGATDDSCADLQFDRTNDIALFTIL